MFTTTVRRAALAAALLLALPLSLGAQTGTKSPSAPDNSVPSPNSVFLPNAVITQGFDTVIPSAGAAPVNCVAQGATFWVCDNQSSPVGTTGWFNPSATPPSPPFPAQAGAATAYIAANFNNTGGTGTISNWLMTPQVQFNPGATLTFWTRTTTAASFPDRLQVRISTAGASTNVGTLATDVGDFTTLVLDVNAGLTAGPGACTPPPTTVGYPNAWCQFTLTSANGIPTTGSGRIAFRYFVTNGGLNGANSDFIGIDTFSFDEGVAPTNTDLALTQSNNATANALLVGSTFQKTLTVTNNGPSAATAITVTDTLPAQLAFVSSNCGATAAGQVVTWTIPALAVSASASCILTVRVAASGTIVNTAAITAQTPPDSTPANNTTTAQIGPTGGAIAQTAVPAHDLTSVLVLLGLVSALGMLAMRQRQA